MHFNACRCATSNHRHVVFSFTTLSQQNDHNNSLHVHDLINEPLRYTFMVESIGNYVSIFFNNFLKYMVAEGARARTA